MNRFALLICFLTVESSCSWSPKPEGNVPGAPVEPNREPPVEPAFTPPPITGGNMAGAADGTWVVADADRATLWHLDGTQVLGQATLNPDDFPGRVITRGPRAFVVLRSAGQIAEFDLATHTLTRRDTCTEPRSLAFRGDELLVGCSTGTIEAFTALGTRTTLLHSELLSDLRDLEVESDRLLITTFRNAQVFELREGSAPRVLLNPAKGADSEGRRFVPRVAWRLRSGLIVAQDEQVTPLAQAYYGPPPGADGGLLGAALYRVEGQRVVQLPSSSQLVLPVDAVESEGHVFLVSAGTDELVRVTAATGEVLKWPLPGQPTSVAINSDTLAVFLREPARLMLFSLQGALRNSVVITAPSALSTSHDLFHRSTPSGLACASCHPEAGEDGHAWNFAGAVRRTPSLRGGLSTTAPFHWDGAERDLTALMRDVMVTRMQGPPQSPQRIAALSKWLDAQPALEPQPVDVVSAARGRVLFESSEVGCVSCHTGEQGTNNAWADVGTGGSFQIPRLIEVGWRSPLFHDGRLLSLEARFLSTAGGELHGHVEQLGAEERADLVAYLKSK